MRLKQKTESTPVKLHQPCFNDECGSSDAMTIYSDGHGFCFSCETHFKNVLDIVDEHKYTANPFDQDKETKSTVTTKTNKQYLPWRGVTADTMRFYGVLTSVDEATGKPLQIVYPFGDKAAKVRDIETKDFHSTGLMKEAGCFGVDKFTRAQSKAITITEGEQDALSAFQIMGSMYPTISVKSASSAVKDVTKDFDFINSFEKIYLAFDNDKAGQEALRKVASMFDPNKVFHVKMDKYKDANEYLVNNDGKLFYHLWWNAKKFMPKGIIAGLESVKEALSQAQSAQLATYPFETLNKMTYGIREGEVILLTAQEKMGKALTLDTPLPTPTGWTTVGKVKVGDYLITRDGSPTKVTFVTEDMTRRTFDVTFQDGTTLTTSDHHKWTVRTLNGKEVVLDTLTMCESGVVAKGSKAKYMVPTHAPLGGEDVDLPIDPMLLGAWLADGHSYSAYITLSKEKLDKLKHATIRQRYCREGKVTNYMFEELTYSSLRLLGLIKNKHIPLSYLRASAAQRQALMDGMMFDGWKNEFYTTRVELLDGFLELARSLGYVCKVRNRDDYAYTVRFKKVKYKAIRDIVEVPAQVSRCLTVDDDSHLFVAGDGWTLTHNTEVFRAIEHHLAKTTDYKLGIIHLEEQERRCVEGLIGYELGVPAHLPDCGLSLEDKLAAFKELERTDGRIHFYSHFGSDDPDTIIDVIRYLVAVCGCKFIFLDHITMLVTGFEGDDERKKLDYISTRLAMLTRELKFTLFLISHVNDDGKTRGSRNISKIADLIVSLNRDLEAADPVTRNSTALMIKGNRYASMSGPAGTLFFDPTTYRLTELGEPKTSDNSDFPSAPKLDKKPAVVSFTGYGQDPPVGAE